MIGYSAGMALYVLVVVALYPAFEHSSSLDTFVQNDSTAAALFGVTGPLSTSGGWLNGNIYANFYPLIALLLTIGYGAASLAGQDEDGTLCLLATLPLRRRRIVLEKAAAMVAQIAVLAVAVALCTAAGRFFHLTSTLGHITACSVSVGLMALDFGLVAMAVGSVAGRRGTAIGIAAVLAAVSYLVGSLAAVVSWLHAARYASLFYWAVGHDQIGNGVDLADWAVLVTVALCALAGAVAAFGRAELH